MNKGEKFGIGLLVVLVLGILFRMFCVVRIPANTVGVVVSATKGVQDTTLRTGYHIIAPLDRVYKMPTSVQSKTMYDITTQTQDGQWLNTDIDIKYQIDQDQAMTVFSNYLSLDNVNENVIVPAVQRAVESITGEYDVYDILGAKRTEVYEKIDGALDSALASYNLKYVSFTITDTDAGEAIENAIRAESVKQKEIDTALQEQEKAKVEAETAKIKAQAEADVKLIEAQAEADANRALSQSITPEIIQYTEAQARLEHGWVEVQGAGAVIAGGTN